MNNEEFNWCFVHQPLLKRSVSSGSGAEENHTRLGNGPGFYLNPDSQLGSDVSDLSVGEEPSTSLSLSLPGVEPSEMSSVSHPSATEKVFPATEFMCVMQEMIRMEVRNYITGVN